MQHISRVFISLESLISVAVTTNEKVPAILDLALSFRICPYFQTFNDYMHVYISLETKSCRIL